MSKQIFIGERIENDYNIILSNIYDNQKEKIEKLERRFNIFDSEKRKKKLKMIAIIYSTCFTALGYLKSQDITKEDIEIVNSLYSNHENNQIASLFNHISSIANIINNQKSKIIKI